MTVLGRWLSPDANSGQRKELSTGLCDLPCLFLQFRDYVNQHIADDFQAMRS